MDHNFEDWVKNSMDDHPEIPFNKKAWDKLQLKLTAEPKASRNWKSWLPFLLLTLFLLAGGLHYYIKYSIAAEKLTLLEHQLHNNFIVVDTLFEKQSVVIYDTTYTTVEERIITLAERKDAAYSPEETLGFSTYRSHSKDHAASSFSPDLKHQINNFLKKAQASSIQSAIANTFFYKTRNSVSSTKPFPIGIDNTSENLASELEQTKDNSWALSALPHPLFKNVVNDLTNQSLFELDQNKRRKGVGYYLSYAAPSQISIGAIAGRSRQIDFDFGDYETILSQNNKVGLRSEIGFGKQFGVLLGLEYFTNEYEVYTGDTKVGEEAVRMRFPDIPGRSDNDLLHEVVADFRYLQIPIGIQYHFLPTKKLQPYIGLGIISRKALRSKIAFEYLGMEEIYMEYNHRALPSSFQVQTAFGFLGFKYNLTKHWQLLFEGRLEEDFGGSADYYYEQIRVLKWHTGFQYVF